VRHLAGAVLARLADGLDRGAQALRTGASEDLHSAQKPLRAANLAVAHLQDAQLLAGEAARMSRLRRTRVRQLRRLEGVGDRLGSIVSTGEALVEAAGRLRHPGGNAPEDLAAALEALAEMSRAVAAKIDLAGDDRLRRAQTAVAYATAARCGDPRPTAATAATLARSLASGLLTIGRAKTDGEDRRLAETAETVARTWPPSGPGG
jgi:hypothetical protein